MTIKECSRPPNWTERFVRCERYDYGRDDSTISIVVIIIIILIIFWPSFPREFKNYTKLGTDLSVRAVMSWQAVM